MRALQEGLRVRTWRDVQAHRLRVGGSIRKGARREQPSNKGMQTDFEKCGPNFLLYCLASALPGPAHSAALFKAADA